MAKYGRDIRVPARPQEVEQQPVVYGPPVGGAEEAEPDQVAVVLLARAKTCVVMWAVVAGLVAVGGGVAGFLVSPLAALVGVVLGAALLQYGMEKAFWYRLEAHRFELLARIAANTRP